MNARSNVGPATVPAVLGGLLLMAGIALAQAPAVPAAPAAPLPAAGVGGAVPPKGTLWNFLGVPQGVQKIRGQVTNRRGNNPEAEPKPPLKAIADPANLTSPNPAIKKAAEIKIDEDMAPQKIKSLKYLATVGCGCYPGLAESLVAALDDCTEVVRFQAAISLCETAGSPCATCNKTSCCNPIVKAKLKDLALGKDQNGCFKEPSPRVRAAALNALNSCEMVMPPEPTEEPPKIEELHTGAGVDQRANPTHGNIQRVSMRQPAQAGAPKSAAALADDDRPPAAGGSIYPTAYRPRRFTPCPPCPQEGMPAAPATPTEPEIKPEPGVVQPEPEMPIPEAASPTALAGTFGAATGPGSAAPYMIGDFFGGGSRFTGLGATNASVGVAGGDRRFKIVESNTPMPQDRLFFNYHHFENAVVDMSNGVRSLNRYTFGIEKTFGNKQNSLEFRLPFTSGYSSDQELGEGASLTGSELGDFAWAYKRILIQNDRFAVSAGLGVVYPTGDDWRITTGQTALVVVENEATHLQPFLGAVWQPNDRLFFQTFTQFDFDTTGNNVFMLGGVDGQTSRLAYVGTLQEQNLMFIDLSAGYWVYQNPCRGWLTGIAPVIELHYSTTMQDGDEFVGAQGVIGNDPTVAGTGFGRRDVLNLTAGMHFQMGTASTLTVAAVAPLRSGDDREYDSEFSVQFNHRF